MRLSTRSALRARLSVEELERREVLSGYQPTAAEQVFLERLNDARANPAAYGSSIGIDLSYIAASQPLAFDPALIQSARDHSQDMNDKAYFGHTGSDGTNPGQRMTAAGYPWQSWAESIAAGYSTPEDALKGLIIDSGVPSLGHRNHLLANGSPYSAQREVGVGIVQNGTGPYQNYYTIDSGYTADSRPYLTGVVYNDLNSNGKYDAGEGLGGVSVTVGGVSTTTWATGGYSLHVGAGTYMLTVSGGALASPQSRSVTVGSANVRANFIAGASAPANRAPTLAAVSNQTMSRTQGSLTVPLSASDPDGDTLTYTATVQSQAYTLDQQYGFYYAGSLYTNYYGRGEKWFLGTGGQWFFILPNGQLYKRVGNTGANGTLIATLEPAYYQTPSLLYSATRGATVQVTGNQLTVTTESGFVGKLTVTVTVSDGKGGTDTKSFVVTVS